MLVIITILIFVTTVTLIGLTTGNSPHYPEYEETFEDAC